jgi:serine phosphatase RsbU (regulator of sigma subunit)
LGAAMPQATCLAMRIAADGAVTLANAGHMPPYLNGKPLPMEGAWPLGITADAQPSVMHFALRPGDKLVLTSDGIVEAMNPQGQLFARSPHGPWMPEHIKKKLLEEISHS